MDQGLSYTSTPYNYILITGNEKFSHIEQFNTAMANENGQVQFVAREWSLTYILNFIPVYHANVSAWFPCERTWDDWGENNKRRA